MTDERDEEHGRRDERAAEGRDERVLGRVREPSLPRQAAYAAGDDRVERQPERDDERGATELRHQAPPTCPARTSTGTS